MLKIKNNKRLYRTRSKLVSSGDLSKRAGANAPLIRNDFVEDKNGYFCWGDKANIKGIKT